MQKARQSAVLIYEDIMLDADLVPTGSKKWREFAGRICGTGRDNPHHANLPATQNAFRLALSFLSFLGQESFGLDLLELGVVR
jgi:hypothetical protein